MRVLITGGSGFLGQHLVPMAAARHEVCYTFYSRDPLGRPEGRQLDLRDGTAVAQLLDQWQPEAIIHTACSDRSSDMAQAITASARHLTAAASRCGSRLIHLSTDVLFDGRQAPYTEQDPPKPVHAYGQAKEAAEAIVAQHPDHVIVRTSLIYSPDLIDHSTRWIQAGLETGEQITLFSNQLRNPVSAYTLAAACLELTVECDYQGVLHVAGDQVVSRAEYGLKLLDWWSIPGREQVTIGPGPEPGPHDCRLDLTLAKGLLATPLPGLDEVLGR